jgi:3-deoxy-D-manno-octulosonic-acid transferase
LSLLLNAVYVLLFILLLPYFVYAAIRKGKYREGFGEKLLGLVPVRTDERPCIWLHAVSVGEVNLLASLLAEIQRQLPRWQCVISTTTMTGYALAKKKYDGHTVFYCPLDFSWAVGRAMRRIRPRLLVLAELELWPNLIRDARRHGARVAIVNGRLSDHSSRGYRRLMWLVRPLLRKIDLIAVQNERYADRFRQLEAREESVHVTGNVKFDGAETDRKNATTVRLASLAGIHDNGIVFLAGSTQEPEEQLALSTYQELSREHPQLRLILVPRHPDRFDAVADIIQRSGVPWQRRSQLEAAGADPQARVLLVDAVGELGAWWGMAQIAFVGGSMGSRGGQNMIEPAAYGAAVSFGPKTKNFRDIVDLLLAADAARVVSDGQQLTSFVRRCLKDSNFAHGLGQRASELVQSQIGATRSTVELIEALAGDDANELRRRDSRHDLAANRVRRSGVVRRS